MQLQVISYLSCSFTEGEQKFAVIFREITAIVYALEICESLLNGSKHPITFFTDQKPILSLYARKGNVSHRFFRYQFFFHTVSKI